MNSPRWTIGSRALTVGGNWPLLNAGKLVVIVWYDPNKFDARGRWVPFFVQRIDGGAFGVTTTLDSTRLNYGGHARVWVAPENLHILPDLLDREETLECDQALEVAA